MINIRLLALVSMNLLLGSLISGTAIANEYEEFVLPTGGFEGGGARGGATITCGSGFNNPVSIMPQNQVNFTTSPSPELFFHVPDVIHASALDIVLLNHNREVVFQNSLDPGYRPGIITVDLVDMTNADGLALNQIYQWQLVQDCENNVTPSILASGVLKRITLEPKLAQKIEMASAIDKIRLYQEANIWHEAIADVAQLKCKSSEETSAQLERMIQENSNLSQLLAQAETCIFSQRLESVVMESDT